MKIQEFLEEVFAELKNLREKATTDEIDRLCMGEFDHTSIFNCIYGQMTDSCRTSRAQELMPKGSFIWTNDCIESLEEDIVKMKKVDSYSIHSTLTGLEIYLFYTERSLHYKIIEFLKGRIEFEELQSIVHTFHGQEPSKS